MRKWREKYTWTVGLSIAYNQDVPDKAQLTQTTYASHAMKTKESPTASHNSPTTAGPHFMWYPHRLPTGQSKCHLAHRHLWWSNNNHNKFLYPHKYPHKSHHHVKLSKWTTTGPHQPAHEGPLFLSTPVAGPWASHKSHHRLSHNSITLWATLSR